MIRLTYLIKITTTKSIKSLNKVQLLLPILKKETNTQNG